MNARYSQPFGLAVFLAAMTAVGTDVVSADTVPLAQQIYDATGVTSGLVVHVGCGDATLTAALGAGTGYLVQGLNSDADQVETGSRYIQSKGLSSSVSLKHWKRSFLPYADNLANLVVSENLGPIPAKEVLRVLAPGGVAYVKADGVWVKTVKPWPTDIDEWDSLAARSG